MSASRVDPPPAFSRVAAVPPEAVRDAVRRRSVSLHAGLRVAEAIRAVALDIVGDPDSLSPADRTWLRQALAAPVNEATEEALRVLVAELSSALGAAPGRVRPQIVTAPLITRTDFE